MAPVKASFIRAVDKKIIKSANSEYMIHFSSFQALGSIGFYEARFRDIACKKNLHYHKIMTEMFTVIEGEFFFDTGDQENVLRVNDSMIIPPMVVHGFRAKLPDSRLQFVFTALKGREEFFSGLAKIARGEMVLNTEELEAFYNKFDQYTVF